LQIVRGRYTRRDDFGFLIAPPIVVRCKQCTITVPEFHGWISERSRYWQRWANRTHNYPERILPKHNQPADQNVISCLDKAAGGNVGQLGIDRSIEIVCFHHSDTSPIVDSADNGCISRAVCSEGSY